MATKISLKVTSSKFNSGLFTAWKRYIKKLLRECSKFTRRLGRVFLQPNTWYSHHLDLCHTAAKLHLGPACQTNPHPCDRRAHPCAQRSEMQAPDGALLHHLCG